MVTVVPRAAHAFSVLALGWYVSRFQRFCRFAARETGTFDSARSSMAQLSMGDRLLSFKDGLDGRRHRRPGGIHPGIAAVPAAFILWQQASVSRPYCGLLARSLA